MKYTTELTIKLPRNRVIELFDSTENLYEWQEGLLSFELLEGEAGQEGAVSKGDPTFRVLLEDVQDPRNLGALLRVCDGAGVGEVLIRDRGSSPLSPAVLKTSAGAVEGLEISRITNSANLIRDLKKQGFWIYGAAAEGQPVWEVDLAGPLLICLGGEEKGLRHHTRELCDALVSLPMQGRVESLNVATAAAAILFEALRQRLPASGGPGKKSLTAPVAPIEEKG